MREGGEGGGKWNRRGMRGEREGGVKGGEREGGGGRRRRGRGHAEGGIFLCPQLICVHSTGMSMCI